MTILRHICGSKNTSGSLFYEEPRADLLAALKTIFIVFGGSFLRVNRYVTQMLPWWEIVSWSPLPLSHNLSRDINTWINRFLGKLPLGLDLQSHVLIRVKQLRWCDYNYHKSIRVTEV